MRWLQLLTRTGMERSASRSSGTSAIKINFTILLIVGLWWGAFLLLFQISRYTIHIYVYTFSQDNLGLFCVYMWLAIILCVNCLCLFKRKRPKTSENSWILKHSVLDGFLTFSFKRMQYIQFWQASANLPVQYLLIDTHMTYSKWPYLAI